VTVQETVQVFLMTAAGALVLSLLVFWVWMLVDCLSKESKEGNDRLIWTLVIVFTKLVGATLYFFMRYRRRGRHCIASTG
jgi:hypothetical protein